MIKRKLIGLAATVIFSGYSHAVFIDGSIAINLAAGSSVSYDATSVDFSDGPGNSRVVGATGDYSFLVGDLATYFDFSFAPLMDSNNADGNPDVAPGVYVWEIVNDTGIHFIIDSVTGGVDSDGILGLTGTGRAYMNAQDMDITPGNWSFSADGTSQLFNFSSTSEAIAPVSDSGVTLGMLGLSLAGLASLAGFRKKRAVKPLSLAA